MSSMLTSPTFLWQSCAQPSAAWFLIWMPIVLLALEDRASLGSAMIRLLAVLLVTALIWARGLGPTGVWSERFFVAGWAVTWAAALGVLVTAGGGTQAVLGSVGLLAALLIGAGWLGWACQMRHGLRAKAARKPWPRASDRIPASASTISMTWLLAALIFFVALASRNAHWGDGVVLGFALGGFTAFQRGALETPQPEED